MTPANKWWGRFLAMADLVASWSKDPSTQVGAVIADHNQRIVSLGFNGLPRGVRDDERLLDRETKYKMVLHAESNAILFATGASLADCTIYVTRPPCAQCAAMIIQKGIKRVVCKEPPTEFSQRWGKDIELAASMFAEAGIPFEMVPHEAPGA